jgi:anti-anti-sigma regulatory factor
MEKHAEREKTPVQTLVLDSSGINFVDITAMEVLGTFLEKQHAKGVQIAVIYLRRGFREALEHMPGEFEVTILHNLSELRQFCIPQNKTLVLSGSRPDKIERPNKH